MDQNDQRRSVLGRAVSENEWAPEIDSDDGETLRTLAELGWVELGGDGLYYHPSPTERGLERHFAWGGEPFA